MTIKKILIGLFFSLIVINLQAQDYIDKITLATCDCLSKISDTTNYETLTMKMGLCMFEVAGPYKKQLKKDYDINLDKIDENSGESLGKLIGMKMASVCPDKLMKIYNHTKKEEIEEDKKLESIGTVTSIEKENFVVFSVFDNSGKSMKFYWLAPLESNIDLANNYKTLLDATVKIKYSQQEYFDPKINEYRNFNVIEKLDKVFK